MSLTLQKIKTAMIVTLSSVLLVACGGGGSGVKAPSGGESVTGSTAPVAEQTETTAVASKSLKLAWLAPKKRQNGEYMSIREVAGYEIQYRKTGDSIFNSTVIDSPYTLEYTLNDLEPGQYEIKMATFDVDQQYGDFSHTATVTL